MTTTASRMIEKASVSLAASLLATMMFFPPAARAQDSPKTNSSQVSTVSSHDRWLHVRVTNPSKGEESVRVNVPLELAEKVLPTINKNRLHSGRVKFDDIDCHGVDLRALVEACRIEIRMFAWPSATAPFSFMSLKRTSREGLRWK